jgi:dTDP-4-amino-4,6-dideoxygalactose transaminase
MQQQEVYINNHIKAVDLSISEKLTEVSISLPIHPYQTLEETNYVCKSISEFINS